MFLECAQNAIEEVFHILPFLFGIFVVTELVEYFYFDKIAKISKCSKSTGPMLGAFLAAIPQCGFSVIASALYIKKFITKGTLLAVYISTSDEAVPVLLSQPEKFKVVLPIVLIKIGIAIIAGYMVDFFFPFKGEILNGKEDEELGCCKHNVSHKSKKDLIFHPIIHTISVSFFVFVIMLAFNLLIVKIGGEAKFADFLMINSIFQPVVVSLFALVPNCAVSLAITLMYIKGVLTFASTIAGLCASAGLGLLVLIRKNDSKKDTIFIIAMLLFISILSGMIFTFVHF